MHKSYNSYTPVASKLLQKRWDSTTYDKHAKSVKHAKPMIDSRPPLTFMHLHLKLKKLQLEEERLATIERDNRILLEKMSTIMRTKGRIDNKNDVTFKSLSRERRERELLRITKENQDILKRIVAKKPEISAKDLKKDWDQNAKFLNNISAFPEDWYRRSDSEVNKVYSARSNNNSHRPKLGARSSTFNLTSTNTESNNNNNNHTNRSEKKSSPTRAEPAKAESKKKDSYDEELFEKDE